MRIIATGRTFHTKGQAYGWSKPDALFAPTPFIFHLGMVTIVMRRRISGEVWDQVDVAIAAGIGCREIARSLGLPAGTVLAHSKRKGLRQQITAAKRATQSQQSDAITPLQSVVVTMQQRGERYVQRLAGVSERVLPHLESMEPDEILGNARNLEQFDRVARRNFGLDSIPPSSGAVNVHVLTNQAAVQVISSSTPAND